MQFSNFKLTKITGSNSLDLKFKATVDATKKNWYLKNTTTTVEIFKTYVGCWRYADSGEYTPGGQVGNLCSAYENAHNSSLQYIKIEEK